MVTVRNDRTTITPGANECDATSAKISYSYDAIVASGIAPASPDLYSPWFLAGPEYSHCGVLQRRWWAKQSCAIAEDWTGFHPKNFGFFDPSSGEESLEETSKDLETGILDTYCMLREPRKFQSTCSNGGDCNAGGECVAAGAPALNIIATPLAQ
jgi:hypothetical protein